MSGNVTLSGISPRDRGSLWAVFSFLLLCVARNKYFSFIGADPVVHYAMTTALFDLLLVLSSVSILIFSTRVQKELPSFWGLTNDKYVRYFAVFIVLVAIYFAWFIDQFHWKDVLAGLLITATIMSVELVLRAYLINVLIRVVGRNKGNVILSLAIASIVYSIAIPSHESYATLQLGQVFVLSVAYYYTGSILLTAFFVSCYYPPNEYCLYVSVASLLLYFSVYYLSKIVGHAVPLGQGD